MVTMDLMRYSIYNSHLSFKLKHANITTPINQAYDDPQTKPLSHEIKLEHPELTVNSDDFFASLGMMNMDEFIRQAAQRGKQAVMEKTGEYASDRRQLGDIHIGVTPVQIYNQKLSSERSRIGRLEVARTGSVHTSFTAPSTEISFSPQHTTHNWHTDRAIRKYTASDFTGQVDRRPRVDIKYIGPQIKTPLSANEPVNTFYKPFDKKV